MPRPRELRAEGRGAAGGGGGMAAEGGQVGGSWEWAAVLAFFVRFWGQLGLPEGFTVDALEEGLEGAGGGASDAALMGTHEALLRGLHPRLREGAWLPLLAQKVERFWFPATHAPFAPEKGQEASDYSNLSPLQKLAVLRLLCDVRLSEGKDTAARVASAARNSAHPRKALKEAGRYASDLEWLDDFRGAPLGQDAEGGTYWWVCLPHMHGFRLFREAPKRGGGGTGLLPAPAWSTVAREPGQLEVIASRLLRSPSRFGQKMGRTLLDEVLPDLERRARQEERRVKALLRTARGGMDARLILNSDAGERRSRRNVARVNYTDQLEDPEVEQRRRERAERREQKRELEERRLAHRREKALTKQAEKARRLGEALNTGLRRGRSAAAFGAGRPGGVTAQSESGDTNQSQSLESGPSRGGLSTSDSETSDERPESISEDGAGEACKPPVREPGSLVHDKTGVSAKSVGSGQIAPVARQGPLLSWKRPGTSQVPTEPRELGWAAAYSGNPRGCEKERDPPNHRDRFTLEAETSGRTGGTTSRSESPDSSESFQPSEAHESADEISEPSSCGVACGTAYSRLLTSGLLAPPCTNPRRTLAGKRRKYVESDSESAESIED